MSLIINCYNIIDGISVFELASVSDTGCLNVKYFQLPLPLPLQQLSTYSQHFEHPMISCDLCDWYEWLREGSRQFKYLKIVFST